MPHAPGGGKNKKVYCDTKLNLSVFRESNVLLVSLLNGLSNSGNAIFPDRFAADPDSDTADRYSDTTHRYMNKLDRYRYATDQYRNAPDPDRYEAVPVGSGTFPVRFVIPPVGFTP
jgi:hypothetical protein